MASDKVVEVTCKLCGTVEDGAVISLTSKEDKVLICKNCLLKIKES